MNNKKEYEREELHKTIWRIANELRGSVDGWDFKQYVLGFLFYRFISENLTNYINELEPDENFDYAALPDSQAEYGRTDTLKEKGIWIYGADIEGKDYSYNVDFGGPCAIVIGSEGKGISNLTLKKCDVLVKIPMIGKINSLNASVAGGIMMYEVLKGRITK